MLPVESAIGEHRYHIGVEVGTIGELNGLLEMKPEDRSTINPVVVIAGSIIMIFFEFVKDAGQYS